MWRENKEDNRRSRYVVNVYADCRGNMPFIFLNDGYPDARDYDSNYLYYDEDDIGTMERVLEVLQQKNRLKNPEASLARATIIRAIERKRNKSPKAVTDIQKQSGQRRVTARCFRIFSLLRAFYRCKTK